MESKLLQKLQELNTIYKSDCKVKFIDSDHSYYHKGVITIGLETTDPVWTLCHEFKHFLQDHKQNYLYLLKHKIIKRTIWYTVAVMLFYYLVAYTFSSGKSDQAQIWIMAYLFLFAILIYPPLMGAVKELYKDLNHHLEFEADRFATKYSGVIPYQSQMEEEGDTMSHPSWSSRIATLEEEFPQFKIN